MITSILISLNNNPLVLLGALAICMFLVLHISRSNLPLIALSGFVSWGIMFSIPQFIKNPGLYQVGTCFEYTNPSLARIENAISLAELNKEDPTLLKRELATAKAMSSQIIIAKTTAEGNIAYDTNGGKYFSNFTATGEFKVISCSKEIESKITSL